MNILNNKWFLLAILSITWGSSFILIKRSITVFTPYEVGALRLTIAGLALLYFGIKSINQIPKKLYKWIVLGGCLGNFIPMFLFPMAQEKVTSSMAGILNSLVPIFILLFGFLVFKIKSTKLQILGAIIGFIGASILMSQKQGGDNDIFYLGLIVLATMCYGMNGLIISKYLNKVPSFKLSSAVFSIWLAPSVLILGLSGFFTDFKGTTEQWQGLGYVTILGLLGTALAMILFYKLINSTSAIFASSVTYLMPLVAVIWGIIDGEQFSFIHAIGGVLILLGIYLIKENKPKQVNSN